MKAVYAVKNIFDRILFICAILATFAIIAIMLALVSDSVFRWFNTPIYGVFELTNLLIGINIYLGLAFVQKQKKHITVTLISETNSKLFNSFLHLFPYVLATVFFAWISYLYGGRAIESFVTREVAPGVVKFPMYPLKFSMFIGIVLLTIQNIFDLIIEIYELFFKKTDSTITETEERGGSE